MDNNTYGKSSKENKALGKDDFVALVNAYVHRDGIESLMAALDNSDFYTAPASTRFHGSFDGGLCAHSIAVGKRLMALADLYAPGVYSKETLVVVSLFHDLCKIGTYKRDTRNVKNEAGKWEQVPYFKFEEDFSYGGHGDKSVFLIMEHMKLTREEAAAINAHMGFAGVQNIAAVSDVYDKNLLAWMLHVADEAATYIDKV